MGKGSDTRVRAQATGAKSRSLKRVIEAAGAGVPSERSAAALSLSGIGSKKALRELVKLFAGEVDTIVKTHAKAQLELPKHIKKLSGMLVNEKEGTRRVIRAVLRSHLKKRTTVYRTGELKLVAKIGLLKETKKYSTNPLQKKAASKELLRLRGRRVKEVLAKKRTLFKKRSRLMRR